MLSCVIMRVIRYLAYGNTCLLCVFLSLIRMLRVDLQPCVSGAPPPVGPKGEALHLIPPKVFFFLYDENATR